MARIVNTCNYGMDYPDEGFVLFPMDKDYARQIADLINYAAGEHSSRYWKVVPNDYVLKTGFEP